MLDATKIPTTPPSGKDLSRVMDHFEARRTAYLAHARQCARTLAMEQPNRYLIDGLRHAGVIEEDNPRVVASISYAQETWTGSYSVALTVEAVGYGC